MVIMYYILKKYILTISIKPPHDQLGWWWGWAGGQTSYMLPPSMETEMQWVNDTFAAAVIWWTISAIKLIMLKHDLSTIMFDSQWFFSNICHGIVYFWLSCVLLSWKWDESDIKDVFKQHLFLLLLGGWTAKTTRHSAFSAAWLQFNNDYKDHAPFHRSHNEQFHNRATRNSWPPLVALIKNCSTMENFGSSLAESCYCSPFPLCVTRQ